MGDDTWMSVFPDAFGQNLSFPYDSFNVEDLHTVDNGVITHLFPILESVNPPDLVIGHFLGVDHVGHRVGPDHPSMRTKLAQMDDVLRRVVETISEDTLLIVLGDHGMDRSGDHGGDGLHETSSALWVYSKGPELSADSVPSGLLEYTTFPGAPMPARSIQQIDLVPTLSLLLGLRIPFNSLGAVIPELFWRNKGKTLERALELNAAQIQRYLQVYRSSAHGSELDAYWAQLEQAWGATKALTGLEGMIAANNYARVALGVCRSMWAQFSPLRMAFGLAVMGTGLIACWAVYSGVRQHGAKWDENVGNQLKLGLRGAAAGAVLGMLAFIGLDKQLDGIDALDCVLFGAPLVSSLLVAFKSPPQVQAVSIPVVVLVLHTAAFFSNSFTFWEERVVPYLALTALVPFVLTGIQAPTPRLRKRILGFAGVYAVCIRLIAVSTVCREEQQPYCSVTFTQPVPPTLVLFIAIPCAAILPSILKAFLNQSLSDAGLSSLLLQPVVTPALVAGSVAWVLEWMETAGILSEFGGIFRFWRTWLSRFALGVLVPIGGYLFWQMPLCLRRIIKEEQAGKKQMEVLGFGNAYGAPLLVLWTLVLGVVFVSNQLAGQVVLCLGAVAFASVLELADSARDAQAMQAVFAAGNPSALMDGAVMLGGVPTRFGDVTLLALLGMGMFFGTGHEATLSSIQWKSAFMLSETVVYPWAPGMVVFNAFGPLVLVGVGAVVMGVWNREPRREGTGEEAQFDAHVRPQALRAALGAVMYYGVLLMGTAVSAAVLRRHLMVWKVFAPRFMKAVCDVLAVDVGVLFGLLVGYERVVRGVRDVLPKK